MKVPVVLYGERCVYCKKAKMLIRRALETHLQYSFLDIRYVRDDSEEAAYYTHRYVPAFFCDGTLVFEGNPGMADVQNWLDACLNGDA